MTYGPGSPQPPQWGAPPPAPQWGGPPPQQWQPPQPPKKRRRIGLIIGICLGAVVLLAGGGVAVFIVATDDSVEVHRPAGGPEVVVKAYVDAVNRRDPIGLQNVNCHASTEYPATRAVQRFDEDNVRIRLGKPTTGPGDGAFFEVEVTRNAHPATTTRLDLNREEAGTWCVFVTGDGLPANLPP
ncbi:hypothetical protein [Amycolatopsis nivea]|uniref:hypothetical protein n=1 Tax=Amycolatopsis nivea TaxID=1644109 RepID=UPI00106F2731|nr:hypothetical protein [Amycolatopsis nivea]